MFVLKNLRHAAEPAVLKRVYIALCQSLLSYCITVWGGAAKSSLLPLERAQRAVLKVATFRPILYPTTLLYQYCEVVTVRQLFIYHTILKQHTLHTYDPNRVSAKRRKDIVMPRIQQRFAYIKKYFIFLGPYLYNKINKALSIYHLNNFECKKALLSFLLKLNYEESESLMEVDE